MQMYTFYKMAISDFQNFVFWPQKSECRFLKNKCPKIKILINIQKTEYILQSYVRPACVQNFKPISLFWLTMVQKPSNGNDVIFWNSIFGISNCRTTKQMTFLESWDKTGQDIYLLERKFRFSKFDLFWPELDLILGQMWKWVSPSIEFYVWNDL